MFRPLLFESGRDSPFVQFMQPFARRCGSAGATFTSPASWQGSEALPATARWIERPPTTAASPPSPCRSTGRTLTRADMPMPSTVKMKMGASILMVFQRRLRLRRHCSNQPLSFRGSPCRSLVLHRCLSMRRCCTEINCCFSSSSSTFTSSSSSS